MDWIHPSFFSFRRIILKLLKTNYTIAIELGNPKMEGHIA